MPESSEGAEPRRSPLTSLSPSPPTPTPMPTPTPGTPWSPDTPLASPSSSKGLVRSAGSLNSLRPSARRSLRLSSPSPPPEAPIAESSPTRRSIGRRWSGTGVLSESTCGGSAGDGEASGEGESSAFRVWNLSDGGSFVNLRPDGKTTRTERSAEGSATRKWLSAPGGNPLKAAAYVGMDLTDARVEEPEKDAGVLGKGRKRPWQEGRDAPEMGDELGEGAFTSSLIGEGDGDRTGEMEGFLGTNVKDQISLLTNDIKKVDKPDAVYLDLASGSRVRRRSLEGDFDPVKFADYGTTEGKTEDDNDMGEICSAIGIASTSNSLIKGDDYEIGVNIDVDIFAGKDVTMEDDNAIKTSSAPQSFVVNDNDITFNNDVEMSTAKDVCKHLGSADGSEGQNNSGMQVVSRREADRDRAMALASKFAFFKEDVTQEGNKERLNEEDQEPDESVLDAGEKELSGPFSTAMEIIRKRYEMLRVFNLSSSSEKDECTKVRIQWEPLKSKRQQSCPSLEDICMKVLVDNAEEIESLEGIPDIFKNRLILMLCKTRKMKFRLLDLLVSSNCTNIHLSDCSWATETQFEEILNKCNTKILKEVQLDLSGRCMTDYVLYTTLASFQNSLPMLTLLSLKGAYRLSDNGLKKIALSAPSLRSINLSQCSLVTSLGIIYLAEKLDCVLRKLYIDDCHNVDAMEILSALKKLRHLEVLSLAGLQSVCDEFVHGLIPVCGSDLREFCLAGCGKVTDVSIKTISKHCPSLRVIDLRNLNQLTDFALKHLANGCGSLQKLKLRQTAFSDETVAAFLEASGKSLIELMLNHIEQVAEHTALAISSQCSRTLQKLDLSFCREMTDEALGIIVDRCLCLKILKLFGCTQVTNTFLNGHSNSAVKVIGLKGQVLDEIEIPDFL